MSKRHTYLALSAVLLMILVVPNLALAAQAGEAAAGDASARMAIAISAGFAIGFASGLCGLAQSRAVASACEGIARNPTAATAIRGSLIIGLVLIESLAIYALLVAFLLIFFF